jgi:DNA-binding PadR family transcriptional regulator
MEQEGWITGKWGISENNRRAKFYAITPRGRRQLAAESRDWERMRSTIDRFLAPLPKDLADETS